MKILTYLLIYQLLRTIMETPDSYGYDSPLYQEIWYSLYIYQPNWGNDELVFDGSSMVYDGRGQLVLHAKPFEEDIIYDTEKPYPDWQAKEDISWMYRGLVLGVKIISIRRALKRPFWD